MVMRLIAAIIAVVAITLAGAADARQGDPRLDDLFKQLLTTADDSAAQQIEATIWRIWIESGDDTLDELMQHGTTAMQSGRFKEALASFDEIVESAPEFAEGWNKRATLYYLMEQYAESVRDVERTLALEPRHFGALSGMGLIQSALDDDTAALEWFERALVVNPHMPFIRIRALMLKEKLRGEPI